MEHPFVNIDGLREQSMEELQDAITELTKKLSFAHSMGNQPMIHQIQMALESHQTVYREKMDKAFEKQQIKSQISVEKNGN